MINFVKYPKSIHHDWKIRLSISILAWVGPCCLALLSFGFDGSVNWAASQYEVATYPKKKQWQRVDF